MNVMVYFVLPMVGSLFIVISMTYSMYQMGGIAKEKKPTWWIAAVYIACVLGISLVGNGLLNAVFLLGMALMCKYLYGTTRIYFLYYLVMCVEVYIADSIISILYSILFYRIFAFFNRQELSYILVVVTTRLVEFIVIRINVFVVRRRTDTPISIKQLFVSLILPLFSIFNFYTLLFFLQVYFNEEILWLFLINLILLVGLNLFFVVLADTMSEKQRLENERNLYQQQAKIQFQYYEREEERYEASRKIIHDIRNHVQAMEELYLRNAAGEAAAYAGNIHQMLNRFGQIYYTSNRLLNIILNDKQRIMHTQGIRADFRIGEVNLEFMQDVDITTIFANLLDNAIEAAAKSSNSYVRLRVNPVHDFISICMENSCDKEPVKGRTGYRSQKAGHKGIGMKNIQQVVSCYHGDLQCDWNNGIFETRIMLLVQKIDRN